MFGGIVYSVVAPEQYMSTTTILVIPQRIPENYVRSTISSRIEDRLATIQQQILSRSVIKNLIEDMNLFDYGLKKIPFEDLMKIMQKRIEIKVRGNDSFTLSFIYEDPQKAKNVTSMLSSYFIDENLKIRELQASGTSEFLESQVKETKAKLEKQEEKVRKYKMRFMGELPQQLEANLSMLRGLQDRFKANAEMIRKEELMLEFANTKEALLQYQNNFIDSNPDKIDRTTNTTNTNGVLNAELNRRRSQLSDLTAKYTDQYPDVIRLKNEVERLENKIRETKTSPSSISPISVSKRSGKDQMQSQIAYSDGGITPLQLERKEIIENIAAIEKKVKMIPKREQEMISLMRDYDNIKRTYNELLNNKLQADISQNLEKRQKGEQFQIIDPANLPEKPFKPDRKKILLLAFGIACIFGFGSVVGLETLDQTLHGTEDFKNFYNLPIIASVPIIMDERYKRKQVRRRASLLAMATLYLSSIALFLIYYQDKIITILDISIIGK
jgi:polysaccharide chain length determinant protein (PEP-CTERM system associated)